MKLLRLNFIFTSLFLLVYSCGDDDPIAPTVSNLMIEVSFTMDGQPLEYGTRYTTAGGDEFALQEFRFYLSNIKLRNTATGAFFNEPNSYHLVTKTADSPTYTFQVSDVEANTYTELEAAIGVDNGSNTSLDNVGDLDPSNNMAWNWNTGYKFLLLEGRVFPSDAPEKGLVYHIGTDPNYHTITLPFQTVGQTLDVRANAHRIQLRCEVSEIFKDIDLDVVNDVMFQETSLEIADNYANMLSLTSVE